MDKFNPMTVVAAAEVIASFNSHDDIHLLEVQWGVAGRFSASSKSGRIAGLANIAIEEDVQVYSEEGMISLSRAMVETAIRAPVVKRDGPSWQKLVAGLRFDGFEIVETRTQIEAAYPWEDPKAETSIALVRMLPNDVPGLDFREAESEIMRLLERHGFTTSKGHLRQALSAFNRGEWSSANGELRNFYESYLNEIADELGYSGTQNSKAKRDFLGSGVTPPFLLAEYNEWDSQKTQYVQALMNRMHPHGGHPGLSEEEDATFRLQISLITARLFVRRFDQREFGVAAGR